ncbi:MAG: dienelactone hydrolase family protein [Planctomycetes bacterium]|nr:dienelactone hydrolase family protein [Planctomycetota bacterium]
MDEQTWNSRFEIEVPMRLLRPARPGPARSLAVLLHGMGQNGTVIQRRLGERLLAGGRHLLVPDGPLPFEKKLGDGRIVGRAWYLYTGDQEAFLESAGRTSRWLEAEIDRVVAAEGLEPGRVHLVGYSQGGYQAGLMLLQSPERYASLVSVCSRLKAEIWPDDADASRLPPILVLHGEHDEFLPRTASEASVAKLGARGAPVDFRIFPSGHEFSAEQADALAGFLDDLDKSY